MDLSVLIEGLEGPGEGWSLVRVAGEIDIASAPRLREELIRCITQRGPRVVLDLTDVAFLDSTGLGVIVGVLKRARTLDGDLRLVCPSPTIRRVFEITALDRTMPLGATVEDALAGADRS